MGSRKWRQFYVFLTGALKGDDGYTLRGPGAHGAEVRAPFASSHGKNGRVMRDIHWFTAAVIRTS